MLTIKCCYRQAFFNDPSLMIRRSSPLCAEMCYFQHRALPTFSAMISTKNFPSKETTFKIFAATCRVDDALRHRQQNIDRFRPCIVKVDIFHMCPASGFNPLRSLRYQTAKTRSTRLKSFTCLHQYPYPWGSGIEPPMRLCGNSSSSNTL